MYKRAIVIAALLSVSIPTASAFAKTSAHDQAMSYILADQDKPTEPGDYLYTETDERGHFPQLVSTTAYFEGTHGCRGDKMRSGYVAYTECTYGYAMEIYRAILQEDGTYQMGDYIGLFEVKDTGYGRSTGGGISRVRSDMKCQGTIEKGICVDAYFPTYSECVDWMKDTRGMVFIQVIPAEG